LPSRIQFCQNRRKNIKRKSGKQNTIYTKDYKFINGYEFKFKPTDSVKKYLAEKKSKVKSEKTKFTTSLTPAEQNELFFSIIGQDKNKDQALNLIKKHNLDPKFIFTKSRRSRGKGVIHLAIESKFINLVKYLIEKDKNVANLRDNSQWTPLHIAALYLPLNPVKYLVKKGADVNAKTTHGEKPSAKAEKNSAVYHYLKALED